MKWDRKERKCTSQLKKTSEHAQMFQLIRNPVSEFFSLSKLNETKSFKRTCLQTDSLNAIVSLCKTQLKTEAV